jgi:cytochrome c peroxidase
MPNQSTAPRNPRASRSNLRPRILAGFGLLALSVGLVACPPTDNGGNNGGGGGNVTILKRPSKSGTVAITADDKFVVQVNPDNDSITILETAGDTKVTEFPVGDEPSSVVIAPDDNTAYVAVRAEAKIVKISNFRSAPGIAGSVEVGSEPTGIALSPRGEKLVVAEFAESRVALINTTNMTVIASRGIRNPRAVAISNDGDQDDADEKVIVTEFYGRPIGQEAKDDSRQGAVQILGMSDLSQGPVVLFDPVTPNGFVPLKTSPNQLSSVTIAGDKFYVTATAASPDNAAKFNENVFPLELVGSVSNGTALGVVNLATEIKAQVPGDKPLFMADTIDTAVVRGVGENVFYAVSRGADAVQRFIPVGDNSASLGTAAVKQIDLLNIADKTQQCKNPIGIVAPHDVALGKLYVNCWVSRRAGVISLDAQNLQASVATATPPAAGLEKNINNGERFYFTGRARWSKDAWSSCASCHPDGLSDNITWRFPAGPRQSISMDGTFSHNAVGQITQRILNWSGERDEVIDFERNTRLVSGGKGAITHNKCNDFSDAGEDRISLNPADATDPNGLKVQLGIPVQEIQDTTNDLCTVQLTGGKDWDDIEAFSKTIRPPRAPRTLDAQSVARGRDLFSAGNKGNCAACHAGAQWTLSRRFYIPSSKVNADLAGLAFAAPGHTKMIEAELTGGTPPALPPAQVACVLRNVSSFGVQGDTIATDALEQRAPPANGIARAQGEFAGFNIPSLFGLSVGAPFLHHGQARSLTELFTDPRWSTHLKAGNKDFAPSGGQIPDLVNFLVSIDLKEAPVTPPGGADLCPAVFPLTK